MSPNPPRQQHQEGNTSRNLIATFIPRQPEGRLLRKQRGKSRGTPSVFRTFCPALGQHPYLTSRERSIFSHCKTTSQTLLGANSLNSDKILAEKGSEPRPPPTTPSTFTLPPRLSQFHINKTEGREDPECPEPGNLRHPGFI